MFTNQSYIYILSNRWRNVIYIGMTSDLSRRINQHRAKAVPGFTAKYNCYYLVYYEVLDSYEAAYLREKQLKGWKRSKKDWLIRSMNPTWQDLAFQL